MQPLGAATEHEIREEVRLICTDFPDIYWTEHDTSESFPHEFHAAMAEGGWLGLAVPEEHGGGGLGVQAAGLVLMEVAASGAGMNGCSALHIGIFGLKPLEKFGSDAQRSEFLPRLASGGLHVAFAVTEPDAGTDTTNIDTTAHRNCS